MVEFSLIVVTSAPPTSNNVISWGGVNWVMPACSWTTAMRFKFITHQCSMFKCVGLMVGTPHSVPLLHFSSILFLGFLLLYWTNSKSYTTISVTSELWAVFVVSCFSLTHTGSDGVVWGRSALPAPWEGSHSESWPVPDHHPCPDSRGEDTLASGWLDWVQSDHWIPCTPGVISNLATLKWCITHNCHFTPHSFTETTHWNLFTQLSPYLIIDVTILHPHQSTPLQTSTVHPFTPLILHPLPSPLHLQSCTVPADGVRVRAEEGEIGVEDMIQLRWESHDCSALLKE